MAHHSSKDSSPALTRRELLAGAGAAIGAGIVGSATADASPALQTAGGAAPRTIVFTHTTVITGHADKAALIDVALAISGDRIAAIGPTDQVLRKYPNAETIDGRRKALLPGWSIATRTCRRRCRAVSTRISAFQTDPACASVRASSSRRKNRPSWR